MSVVRQQHFTVVQVLYKKSYDSDVTTNAPPISLESDRVGNDG